MSTRKGRLAEAAAGLAGKRHPEGYGKKQLIEASREVFGGFGADQLRVPKSDADIAHKRNAMALIEGVYPLGMSDCDVVGISGGCGRDCPVFRARRCEHQAEMEAA
jgi:hypothetical protein